MNPPRVKLCQLPTPCHRLDWMSKELGIDLWIKRDDLTGFAMGGNKGRKLEYLIADAQSKQAEVVVTCGAFQSNFIRQLGAACRVCGVRCVAAVMDLPYSASNGKAPEARHLAKGGNVTLGNLFGVEYHHYPNDDWEVLYSYADRLAEALQQENRVYQVPVGGSIALGAYAFYEAGMELGAGFDWVVTASSSGSTQVGLAAALDGTATKVIGISADPEPEIVDDLVILADELSKLIGAPRRWRASDFDFRTEWSGPVYGLPTPEGQAALVRLAAAEGVLLDPVYSAKAFAGLLALVEGREIGGKVLFWHTGGLPALFVDSPS